MYMQKTASYTSEYTLCSHTKMPMQKRACVKQCLRMTVKYTLEEVLMDPSSVSSVYPKSGHLDYIGSAYRLQCTGAHAVTYFYDNYT